MGLYTLLSHPANRLPHKLGLTRIYGLAYMPQNPRVEKDDTWPPVGHTCVGPVGPTWDADDILYIL